MRELHLGENNVNGSLRKSIGQLSNLEVLDVSSNYFTGAVFEGHLQNLSKLQYLDLSSNNFTGVVSDAHLRKLSKLSWLQTQLNLSVLDISNTGINTDAIPDWFCNITHKLRYLNLSFNSIKGTLPNFPLRFDNYPTVDLSSNQFRGPIPLFLANATVLHLSNNTSTNFKPFLCAPMDRSLPSSLKNCTLMRVVDIGKNNLNGGVPKWIGERLTGLNLFSLESNRFKGRLPSSLCYLNYVQILDLSLNNIFGTIPLCLHNFTSMATKPDRFNTLFSSCISDPSRGYERFYDNTAYFMWKGQEYKFDKTLGLLRLIDLSSNRLTGHIPIQVTDLVKLKQLNLSRNHLSRAIPDSIRQLKQIPTVTQLQSFNASAYLGNTGLCGPHLETNCPENETLPGGDERYIADGAERLDMSWFYMGLGVGFGITFLGVFWWILFFKNYYRPGYFRHLLYKLAWD
ncbi:hypothetical protein FEM48_Zijuj09G0075900 [Ziziphus jujuba var. spinosa]|uniref:Uncharacterized protein n=1 Tax=Ziziphus jujuba var. spinosa TaxID=714518 RepID=A0A978URP1_ZIZJJ|nr:hypothetical protein FEM48_Zijuj09G0075900 [Ziziphus jujuba var. spinosa]